MDYRLDAGLANAYNPRMEMEDRRFRQIMGACQQRDDQTAYMQIREFLNRNPLLTDWPGRS